MGYSSAGGLAPGRQDSVIYALVLGPALTELLPKLGIAPLNVEIGEAALPALSR